MKHKKDDLDRAIDKWKAKNPEDAADFEEGYRDFRIGIMLKEARIKQGITQEELAKRIHTQKTSISRLENQAEDVKISTLRRVARALGKKLELRLA